MLALFSKAVRKLYGHLRAAKEAAVERTLPKVGEGISSSSGGRCGLRSSGAARPRAPHEHAPQPTPSPSPALPTDARTQASAAAAAAAALAPHAMNVDDELDEAAAAVREEMRAKYLRPEDLAQFAIAGGYLPGWAWGRRGHAYRHVRVMWWVGGGLRRACGPRLERWSGAAPFRQGRRNTGAHVQTMLARALLLRTRRQ